MFAHEDCFYTIIYTRFRCIFAESYELNNFPFDCQDLSFWMESGDASKAVLCPRFKREKFAVIDTFCLTEWDLYPPVASFVSETHKLSSRSETLKSQFFFENS